MFITLHKNTDIPIIFTCEHASKHIPDVYDNFGLPEKHLHAAKDLYDPGALETAIALQKQIGGSLIHPTFSRLVIDPNRRLHTAVAENNTFHAPALKTDIVVEENGKDTLIQIPGNRIASLDEEEKRWNHYVLPYVNAIRSLVKEIAQKKDTVYIFSIHSFYPVYNGEKRTVDIDIIFKDNPIADTVIEICRKYPFAVGINEPWSYDDVAGGIFPLLQTEQAKVHTLAFDINNKYLNNEEERGAVVESIGDAIHQAIRV